MEHKVQTSFRVYRETLARLDALLASPPAWLNAAGIGPVNDRTEILERLVFLAHDGKIAGSESTATTPVKASPKATSGRTSKRR